MSLNQQVTIAIERTMGFDKYASIMRMVDEVDIATDVEFQILFNDYYDVRRNEEWRALYYRYFAEFKESPTPTFNQIIEKLYYNLRSNKGGKFPVEPSFSSKMLATLDPSKPVLDSHVLENLRLELAYATAAPAVKLSKAKQVYATICYRYDAYMKSKDCLAAIEIFDSHFPDYKDVFSPVRKIDWFLWRLNRNELIEIGVFKELLG